MEGPAVALARKLYKAYTDSSGGLNYQGKPCPPWDDLTDPIRKHWTAAAKCAIEELGAAQPSLGLHA